MLTGHIIHEQPKETSMYKCSLSYAERFLRRKRLETDCGISFVLDLEKTKNLNHGDHIELSDGTRVTVLAKPERLAALRGTNLMELAWHVGNRHTPCQVVDDQLLIQHDHVIEHMIEHLGGKVEHVTRPFTPRGGAYGHGRTHSHEHGASAHVHTH